MSATAPAPSLDVASILATRGDDYERRLRLAADARTPRASQILWRREQRRGSLRPRAGARLDPANPWEAIEQADVADVLRDHPARLVWAHIPNERHGKRSAGILATQGVQAGIPDVVIWTPPALAGCPFAGCAIELKRRRATPSDTSPAQRAWLERLSSLGWLAVLAHGAGPAVALIEAYYGPVPWLWHDECIS